MNKPSKSTHLVAKLKGGEHLVLYYNHVTNKVTGGIEADYTWESFQEEEIGYYKDSEVEEIQIFDPEGLFNLLKLWRNLDN